MIEVRKDGAWMMVNPLGAQMMAYCDGNGKQRLWSGNPDVWGKVAPILFPSIGPSKGDQVLIGGKPYSIPRHGFAKDMLFTLEEQGEDFCTLVLKDSAETQAMYPFAFTFAVTHRLLPTGFVTELSVANNGQTTMPLTIGGHPAFACPMNEGEQFSDYVVRFEKEETGETLLRNENGLMEGTEVVDLGEDRRTLPLTYEPFDQKDSLVFAGIKSRSVELVHHQTGKGIRVCFPTCDVLTLWTIPHKAAPYLCIEPWNGLPAFQNETGNFEDKPYRIDLAPGKQYTLVYQMDIVE